MKRVGSILLVICLLFAQIVSVPGVYVHAQEVSGSDYQTICIDDYAREYYNKNAYYYNEPIKLVAGDTFTYFQVNNSDSQVEVTLSEEGVYNVVGYNWEGIPIMIDVYIDYTLPELVSIKDGDIISAGTEIACGDNYGISNMTYYRHEDGEQGSGYYGYWTPWEVGTYTVTATDMASNESSITITVMDYYDSGLTITGLSGEYGEIIDHPTTVDISVKRGNIYYCINYYETVTIDTKTVSIPFKDDGSYTLEIWDDYYNYHYFHFNIDTCPPVLSISTDGYSYDTDLKYMYNTPIYLKVDDPTLEYLRINDREYSNETYFSDSYYLGDQGVTYIEAFDKEKRTVQYELYIDWESPLFNVQDDFYYIKDATCFLTNIEDNTTSREKMKYTIFNNSLDEYVIEKGSFEELKDQINNLSDGVYVITAYDIADNSSTCEFKLDASAPTTDLIDQYIYTSPVTLQAEDSTNITCYVNGRETELGAMIDDTGVYYITFVDEMKNIKRIQIFIDLSEQETVTLPIRVTGILPVDGMIYDESTVYASVDSGRIFYQINDNEVVTINNTSVIIPFRIEGEYRLEIWDEYDNRQTYNFIIDTSAPVITFSGDGTTYTTALSDHNVNTQIELKIEDISPCDLRIYENGYQIGNIFDPPIYFMRDQGEFTVIATDSCGRETKTNITLDWSEPWIYLLEDGKIYNNESFSIYGIDNITDWFDMRFTLINTDNNEKIISLVSIGDITEYLYSEDHTYGNYRMEIYDSANNMASRTFTLDSTLPTSSLQDGKLYTSPITLSAEDNAQLKCYVNGIEAELGTTLTKSGVYYIEFVDTAANKLEITIFLNLTDRYTEPTNLNITGLIPEDGLIYKEALVNIEVDSGHIYYQINNDDYITINGCYESISFIAEGDYSLRIWDDFNNIREYKFSIDRYDPKLYASKDGSMYSVVDEYDYIYFNTAISLKVEDMKFSKVDYDYYNDDEKISVTLTNSSFRLEEEGKYNIKCYDGFGRVSTFTIIIDKTAPNFDYLDAKKVYSSGIQFYNYLWEDGFLQYSLLDIISNNELLILGENTDLYNCLEGISTGSYRLTAIDYANNSDSIDFLIDSSAPTSELKDRMIYTSPIKLDAEDELSVTCYVNNIKTQLGTYIEKSGVYHIVFEDEVYNKSAMTVYVDLSGNETEQSNIGVYGLFPIDGAVYDSTTVDISVGTGNIHYQINNNKPITINDTYTSITFDEEAIYTLHIWDDYGDSWIHSFGIDCNIPVLYYSTDGVNYYEHEYVEYNKPLFIKIQDMKLAYAEVYKQGEIIATFTDSMFKIEEEGYYDVYFYDIFGRVGWAPLEIDTTAPVFNGISDGDVFMSGGDIEFSIFDNMSWTEYMPYDIYEISSNRKIGTGLYYDELFKVLYRLTEGEYKIVTQDWCGNATSVTFTIDSTAPTTTLQDGKVYNTPVTLEASDVQHLPAK